MLRSPFCAAILFCAIVWNVGVAGQQDKCAILDEQLQPSVSQNATICGEACRRETLEALRAIWTITNGKEGWNFAQKDGSTLVNGNWSDSSCVECKQGNTILPTYCCWVGVSCCHEPNIFTLNNDCATYSVTALQPQSANITGPFDELVPRIQVLHNNGLQYLDLGRNFLTGTIPTAIANLTNLKALLLASNNLTGTVPATIAELTQLEQLDLEFNFLSGKLDKHLCATADNKLETLYLRANGFTGPLNLSNCSRLQIVDIQENGFSGPVPVDGNNRGLLVLRARQNGFDGKLSEEVWTLPRLITLDLTNNSLTGELPQTATPSNQLNRLYLSINNFSGSVPSGFADSSQLTDLDLSDNAWITGELPDMRWMMGLVTFDVSNTRIQGTIPKELGSLPFLQSVDIHNTLMTCCHTEDQSLQLAANNSLVPSFLVLDTSSRQPPIIDFSLAGMDPGVTRLLNTGGNMTCPTVRRSPDATYAHGTGVLLPANLSRQNWVVDPEYYWFQGCNCAQGFTETKSDINSTYRDLWCAENHVTDPRCVQMRIKQCVPAAQEPTLTKSEAIAVAICGAAFCLLMLMLVSVTGNLCIARTGKIRRQLNWWHKHLAGMPKSGKMSIVVTDIEGYSDLFKRCPELMFKALTLHNNVIRRCKYEHCGSTVQQEGDSYTLVFHDAFDAVSFCLQAQQALLEVNWPEGLMDGVDPSGSGHGSSGNGKAARRNKLGQLEGVSSLLAGGPSSWLKKSRISFQKPQGSQHGAGSTASTADGLPVAVSTVQPSALVSGRNSSRSRMLDLFRSHTSTSVEVFNGLRVRMGIATGLVVVDTNLDSSSALANILNSALYKQAVDVSDAGNGGQILMEAETFQRIKEELHPLGAIDANGLNYHKLAQRTSLWHLLFLGALCAPRRQERLDDDEAIVLDMGEYEVPMLPPKISSMKQHAANATKKLLTASLLPLVVPFTRASADGGGQHGRGLDGGAVGDHIKDVEMQQQTTHEEGHAKIKDIGETSPSELQQQQQLQQQQHSSMQRTSTLPGAMPIDYFATTSASITWGGTAGGAAAADRGLSVQSMADMKRPRVRLVQVLAPSLVRRASVWGNKLSLKSSWVCTDAPYFEAPGALEAPLGTRGPYRAISVGGHVRAAAMSTASSKRTDLPVAQQQQELAAEKVMGLGVICSALGTPTDSFNSQQQQQAGGYSGSGTTQTSAAAESVDVQQQQNGYAADIESQVAAQQQQQQMPPQLSIVPRRTGSDPATTDPVAAAAAVASIGSPLADPIPAVTMVFMSVDGAKVFGARRKQVLKDIHSQLSLLLMEALRHVAGGYMCRMQEGDLKYMIAFSNPRSALEWCLLVQETAMYLNWPDDRWQKQRLSQLTNEYDSRGNLVFRGPRLKMGLCEGVPRTIIPDHLGRADYHGSSVNQAARYMDAAAHGGQIACELELALAVLQRWHSTDQSSTTAATAVVQQCTAADCGLVCRAHSAPAASDGGGGGAADAAAADAPTAAVDGGLRVTTVSRSFDTSLSAAEQQQQEGPVARPDSFCSTASSAGGPLAAAAATASAGSSNGTCIDAEQLLPAGAAVEPAAAAVEPAAAADGQQHWRPGSVLHKVLQHRHAQAVATAAAAAAGRNQQQWAAADPTTKPLFGLSDVPRTQVQVQINHLGSFKFKGNPQPLDMVNVTLTSLAGRQQYLPEDPPKGKGNRIAAKTGVAAEGSACIPTLAQQYRARVPDQILHCGVSTSGSVSVQHLRSSSMPVQRGYRQGSAGHSPFGQLNGFSRLGSHQAMSFLPTRLPSGPVRTLSPDSQAAAAASLAARDGSSKQLSSTGALSTGEWSVPVVSSSTTGSSGKAMPPVYSRSVSAVVTNNGLSAGEVLLPLPPVTHSVANKDVIADV